MIRLLEQCLSRYCGTTEVFLRSSQTAAVPSRALRLRYSDHSSTSDSSNTRPTGSLTQKQQVPDVQALAHSGIVPLSRLLRC
jgi:hypothetical protein